MHTDHDMNDLFHRATHDIDVDVPGMVDASALRGRRLERRRTLTRVVAPVLATALALPLGAALLGGGGAPEAPVATSPDQGVAAPRVAAFDDDAIAEQLRTALAELAPDVTVGQLDPGSGQDRRTADASVTLEVPEGTATVGIQIWPLLDDTPESVLGAFCDNQYLEPGETGPDCTPVAGGTLAVSRYQVTQADLDALPEDQRGDGGPGSSLTVVLITEDGLKVSAGAALSLPGSTSSTLPTPPPGEDVLARLVQDPRWLTTATAAAAPTQKRVRRSELTQPEAAALLGELVAEAVPGVTLTAADFPQAAGFVRAALLADDGNGVSRIELTLGQPTDNFDFAQVLSESPPCGEGCVETEEGALNTLTEYSPAKDRLTGVENVAGYQRADGLVVSVNSMNTEAHWVEATRTTRPKPLLSTEQLVEIATSPRWLG